MVTTFTLQSPQIDWFANMTFEAECMILAYTCFVACEKSMKRYERTFLLNSEAVDEIPGLGPD